MATNLAIDDRLIEEARKTGGHRPRRKRSPGRSKNTSGIAGSEEF
jgi:hypothetical protein